MGFEPTEGCPSHAFQACRFGRSRTSPRPHHQRRCAVCTGYLVGLGVWEVERVRFSPVLPEVGRPGPVRPLTVNRVRAGRQQPSADPAGCRRSPGLPSSGRTVSRPGTEPSSTASPVWRGPLPCLRVIPVVVPSLPPPTVLRCSGPRTRHHRAEERREQQLGRSCLFVLRPTRNREDDDRPHPGEGAELHKPARRRTLR